VSAAAPDEPVVACDTEGSQKFLLGPEVVAGAAIQDASVASDVTPTGQPTGYFVANMSFHDEAAQSFSDMTSALYGGEGATLAIRGRLALVRSRCRPNSPSWPRSAPTSR